MQRLHDSESRIRPGTLVLVPLRPDMTQKTTKKATSYLIGDFRGDLETLSRYQTAISNYPSCQTAAGS